MKAAIENVFLILKPRVVGFRISMGMQAEEKLKERLIAIIRELPLSKLTVLSLFLKKITGRTHQSTERTLKMAGAWKDLDGELFLDLTDRLHDRRLHESRSIDF